MQACCDHALSHHLDNGNSATNRGFKTQLRVGVLCRLEDGRAATRQELLVSSYHALPGPKRSFHKAMGRIHSTNQLYNDVQRGVSFDIIEIVRKTVVALLLGHHMSPAQPSPWPLRPSPARHKAEGYHYSWKPWNNSSRQWPVLSLIHISEPTRLRRISYAVFC